MLVPADVRKLSERIRAANKQLPRYGDVALLEWPTSNSAYEMRLSFLEPESELFHQAEELFNRARETALTVGVGACWLLDDLSPSW